jgi:hypothetical protein
MPSTITLKTTADIATRYNYNSPITYVNDGNLAYSMGDEVRQFILSAPFVWRWNRAEAPLISCEAGESDYTVNIPDFGWIERAWILFPPVAGASPGTPQTSKELTVSESLAQESVLGQPAFISVIGDDNNGNITFRLMMVPDNSYTLYIVYQKSAGTFSSLKDTWYPIPDYMSYLYNAGMLAKVYEYKGDERFAYAHQEFLKKVVSASEGLTDAQKNIFLEPRIIYQRETQGSAISNQQGRVARGGQ